MMKGNYYLLLAFASFVYIWTFLELFCYLIRVFAPVLEWQSYDYAGSERFETVEEAYNYMSVWAYFALPDDDDKVGFWEWHFEFSFIVNVARAALMFYFGHILF